jgi:hypothetical protein
MKPLLVKTLLLTFLMMPPASPLPAWQSRMEPAGQGQQQIAADDQSPWETIRPPDSRCEFRLPGQPRQVARTIRPRPDMELTIQMFVLSLQEGKVALVAGYHDAQEMPTTEAKRKEILDGGIKGTMVNVIGKLKSHEETEIEGAPARRFTWRGIRKGQEIEGHSQLVLSGRRVYQLSVIRLAETEPDDELVRQFFASFRLLGADED